MGAKGRRTLAIGDIHGCLRALETLAEEVGFGAGDRIVVLGDIVDRGPDTKGVVEFLMALQKRCELVLLKGNHEIMMEVARRDRRARSRWLGVGGDAVLDSYGAGSMDDIPRSHWEFIAGFRPHFETKRYLFVHANADPDLSLKEQSEAMLFWEPFGDPPPHESGKMMICGHTSQKSGDPINLGHAVCIDTFAHGGGWLSCLDVKSGQLWRANQKGQLRIDHIDEFYE